MTVCWRLRSTARSDERRAHTVERSIPSPYDWEFEPPTQVWMFTKTCEKHV